MLALITLLELPPPAGVWPITVAGWVGLFASFLALAGVLWGFYRAGIERAKKDSADDARMAATDERLNQFHTAVDTQLNGFGRRIEKLESDGASDRSVVNGVLQSLAEAKAHQKYVGDSLLRIEKALENVSNAVMNRGNDR